MQLIDIIILLPILWGGFVGYQRGIIIEIVSIAAFVASVLVSFKSFGFLSTLLASFFSNQLAQHFFPYMSFGVSLGPIVFLINRLGGLLRKSIRYTIFGQFDSFAGGVVGCFTWAFGISILFWLGAAIGIKMPPPTQPNLYIYPIVQPFAPAIIPKVVAEVPAKIKQLQHNNVPK